MHISPWERPCWIRQETPHLLGAAWREAVRSTRLGRGEPPHSQEGERLGGQRPLKLPLPQGGRTWLLLRLLEPLLPAPHQ